MRGQVDSQSGLFGYYSVEERIPADHPLRRVKAQGSVASRLTPLLCFFLTYQVKSSGCLAFICGRNPSERIQDHGRNLG